MPDLSPEEIADIQLRLMASSHSLDQRAYQALSQLLGQLAALRAERDGYRAAHARLSALLCCTGQDGSLDVEIGQVETLQDELRRLRAPACEGGHQWARMAEDGEPVEPDAPCDCGQLRWDQA